MRVLRRAAFFILLLFTAICARGAGTWAPISVAPSGTTLDQLMLLSDGTVMAQSSTGVGSGNPTAAWYRLRPSAAGLYSAGTWVAADSMSKTRWLFSSQVLKNGRLFV